MRSPFNADRQPNSQHDIALLNYNLHGVCSHCWVEWDKIQRLHLESLENYVLHPLGLTKAMKFLLIASVATLVLVRGVPIPNSGSVGALVPRQAIDLAPAGGAGSSPGASAAVVRPAPVSQAAPPAVTMNSAVVSADVHRANAGAGGSAASGLGLPPLPLVSGGGNLALPLAALLKSADAGSSLSGLLKSAPNPSAILTPILSLVNGLLKSADLSALLKPILSLVTGLLRSVPNPSDFLKPVLSIVGTVLKSASNPSELLQPVTSLLGAVLGLVPNASGLIEPVLSVPGGLLKSSNNVHSPESKASLGLPLNLGTSLTSNVNVGTHRS